MVIFPKLNRHRILLEQVKCLYPRANTNRKRAHVKGLQDIQGVAFPWLRP